MNNAVMFPYELIEAIAGCNWRAFKAIALASSSIWKRLQRTDWRTRFTRECTAMELNASDYYKCFYVRPNWYRLGNITVDVFINGVLRHIVLKLRPDGAFGISYITRTLVLGHIKYCEEVLFGGDGKPLRIMRKMWSHCNILLTECWYILSCTIVCDRYIGSARTTQNIADKNFKWAIAHPRFYLYGREYDNVDNDNVDNDDNES